VIFFQDRTREGFVTASIQGLLMATPENKKRAYDLIESLSTGGPSDPFSALQLAFQQKPELIYLLTDGDFEGGLNPGNQAVVDFCAKNVRDGKIKINTIAFQARPRSAEEAALVAREDAEFVRALKAIAGSSGGKFRNVTDDDIGGR
jgi:hypothetical protein